ncbi:kynurenine formamidase-like [Hermetia illucens]|uniref:kynurenine formamidase-like n=1 Tax=Hermetia illucens TaxID=343691 RepID=UPI0018CC4A3C|nr:kynurenine formamidase-like [Hermetia illucens]
MPLNISESDKILNPMRWAKNFSSPEIALAYVHRMGKEGVEKHAKYLKKANIKYGPGEKQLLDIYYKEDEQGMPVVVYIHGGYWQDFSKDISAFWLAPYLENGCRVILVGYDLCPAVTLSELVNEIKDGLKYCLEYAAETNAKAVSIIGHSAGAHLTISALDRETLTLPTINLVKSIYLVTGIYDLTVLINSSVNENNKLTLDESNVEQLSPMLFDYTYLRGHKLKIYVIAAEYESPLFIEQSEGMNKQLEKFNIDSQYKFISGVDHLDILEQLGKNDFELTQLLLEELN